MALSKRFLQYDYLRVTALVFIIAIHTTDILYINNTLYDSKWWFGTLIQAFVRSGLPIFFILSGYLILSGKDEPIFTFYRKRFLRIVIPLFVYSIIYLVALDGHMMLINKFLILHDIKAIFMGPVYFHLWFVYTLMGLYLASPFIKKMLEAMNDYMLFFMMAVIIIYRACMVYFPIVHFNLGINNFIFDGWAMYYILGYVLTRIKSQKVIFSIFLLGLASYVYSIIALRFLPDTFKIGLYDLSPTMLFIGSAIFLFFQRNSFFARDSFLSKIISFISRYSYSIYLIHTYPLDFLFHNRLLIHFSPYGYILGIPVTIIAVFLSSIILAYIIDHLVVNPLTFGVDKCLETITSLFKKNPFLNLIFEQDQKANSSVLLAEEI